MNRTFTIICFTFALGLWVTVSADAQMTTTVTPSKDSFFAPGYPTESEGDYSSLIYAGDHAGSMTAGIIDAIAFNLSPLAGKQLSSFSITLSPEYNHLSGKSGSIPFGHYSNWNETTTYNGLVTGQTFVSDGTLLYTTGTSLYGNGTTLIFYGADLTKAANTWLSTGINPGIFFNSDDLNSLDSGTGDYLSAREGPSPEFGTAVVVPEPSSIVVLATGMVGLFVVTRFPRSRRAGM